MAYRIEVIDALERCNSYGRCDDEGCPYYPTVGCLELLRKDALELLKEQEKEIDEISDEYLDLGKEMAKQPKFCPACGAKLTK